MTEQKIEDRVFKRALNRIKRANGDPDKIDRAMNDMEKELPEGKVKNFLKEVGKLIAPTEKIVEDNDAEKLGEALSSLRAAKAKFKKGEYPEEIPWQIIAAYRDRFGQAIMLVKMIKGFTDLTE